MCHSITDKPSVRNLHTLLIADGFRPWLDEKDLIAGQDWELAIRTAVRASHAVIVCLSRASVTKAGFVQKEIRLALDAADEQPEGSVFLVPLKLENCDVPSRLRKWQWVDYWTPQGYQELVRALRLRARELAATVSCGLTRAEVTKLTSWRPIMSPRVILIVVRNPDLLHYVRWILEEKGWTLMTAESAQSAMEMLMNQQAPTPSIALLDYILPDDSGVAFGVRLRQRAPTMAIVISSMNEPTREDILACKENDLQILMKPFLRVTLVQVLDRARRWQLRGHFEDPDAIK